MNKRTTVAALFFVGLILASFAAVQGNVQGLAIGTALAGGCVGYFLCRAGV